MFGLKRARDESVDTHSTLLNYIHVRVQEEADLLSRQLVARGMSSIPGTTEVNHIHIWPEYDRFTVSLFMVNTNGTWRSGKETYKSAACCVSLSIRADQPYNIRVTSLWKPREDKWKEFSVEDIEEGTELAIHEIREWFRMKVPTLVGQQ